MTLVVVVNLGAVFQTNEKSMFYDKVYRSFSVLKVQLKVTVFHIHLTAYYFTYDLIFKIKMNSAYKINND